MILYIGNFQSEKITKARGIPSRNAAGSNRLFRLAKALQKNNRELEIISPAISLRSKPVSNETCLNQTEEIDNITVYYAKTSLIPFINIFNAMISTIKRIWYHYKNGNLTSVIIYNFSIELLFISLIIKLLTNARIINNVEDVSIPKISDWKSSTEVNAIQQIIFFFCMKLIARLADGFIVPTKKFIPYLHVKKKPVAVITGCCEIKDNLSHEINTPLQVLFSGKIEFEHGIDLLLSSLKNINQLTQESISISICGGGNKVPWLKQELKKDKLKFVSYLGFVSDAEYNKLLSNTDVCISLQNPEGRYGSFKTPSKFYEYYSYGKCVITSNAGDYSELPSDSFFLCEPYTSEKLVSLFQKVVQVSEELKDVKQNAYTYAKSKFDFAVAGKHMINTLEL